MVSPEFLNPGSLEVLPNAVVEPGLAAADERCQFERQGYFCLESEDSKPDKLVFNRIVTLRDSWPMRSKKKIVFFLFFLFRPASAPRHGPFFSRAWRGVFFCTTSVFDIVAK